MLHAFEQIASVNAAGGFPLSRIVCRMDWAAEGKSCVNDLFEFESRVNHVREQHDAMFYTYHLGKFGGGIRVAIEDEQDCSSVLQQIAACRGAINSLIVEIIDGEIRFHVLSKNSKVDSREAEAAENLVEILHRYIK